MDLSNIGRRGIVPRLVQPNQVRDLVARMMGNHPFVIVVTDKQALGYIASKRDFDRCHAILESGEDADILRRDIVLEMVGKPPISTP